MCSYSPMVLLNLVSYHSPCILNIGFECAKIFQYTSGNVLIIKEILAVSISSMSFRDSCFYKAISPLTRVNIN